MGQKDSNHSINNNLLNSLNSHMKEACTLSIPPTMKNRGIEHYTACTKHAVSKWQNQQPGPQVCLLASPHTAHLKVITSHTEALKGAQVDPSFYRFEYNYLKITPLMAEAGSEYTPPDTV